MSAHCLYQTATPGSDMRHLFKERQYHVPVGTTLSGAYAAARQQANHYNEIVVYTFNGYTFRIYPEGNPQ